MSDTPIQIVREKISEAELRRFLGRPFPDMIKFVVDVRRDVVALGGELHADAEARLLEEGSDQADLWGGNLYPDQPRGQQLEFSAFVNIRPSAGSSSMEVKDANLREQMQRIVRDLLP